MKIFFDYIKAVAKNLLFVTATFFFTILALIQPYISFPIERIWFGDKKIFSIYILLLWTFSSFIEYKKCINISKSPIDYKITYSILGFDQWFEDKTEQAKNEILKLSKRIENYPRINILEAITPLGKKSDKEQIQDLQQYIEDVRSFKEAYKNYSKIDFLIQNIGNKIDNNIDISISSNKDIFNFDFCNLANPEYPKNEDPIDYLINKPLFQTNTQMPYRQIHECDKKNVNVELRNLRAKDDPTSILYDKILISNELKTDLKFKIVSDNTSEPIIKKISIQLS